MKAGKLWWCGLFLTIPFMSHSQSVGVVKENNSIYLTDINGMPFTSAKREEVSGSPWLSDDWNIGNVILKFAKKADSIPLKLHLVHNKLLFKRGDAPYEFEDQVIECSFRHSDSGVLRNVTFRSNYPKTGSNSTAVLYQVLAEGPRMHLLQHKVKKITESIVYNAPPVYEYTETNNLYLYDANTRELRKIKNRQSFITDAFPLLKERINRLCREHSWNLKNTDELKLLVIELQ